MLISRLFSSLLSARYAHVFISSLWLEARSGEKPTGDVPGALIHQLVLHQCLISTLRPLRNFPLLLEGFLLVYFLTILLDTLPLPFSSDNE